jgi:hypothetical protein
VVVVRRGCSHPSAPPWSQIDVDAVFLSDAIVSFSGAVTVPSPVRLLFTVAFVLVFYWIVFPLLLWRWLDFRSESDLFSDLNVVLL